MKYLRWIGFALGVFLASGLIESRGEQQNLAGVAAIVNNDVVTYSEVEEFVKPQENAARAKFTGAELTAEIKRIRAAGVEALINRALVHEAFVKVRKGVPHATFEEQVNIVTEELCHSDPAAFMKWVKEQRRAAYVKTL